MIEPNYIAFLSFDCGFKKLGVSHIEIDINILEFVKEIFMILREFMIIHGPSDIPFEEWNKLNNYICRANERMALFIRPIYLDVVDTLPGNLMKDVSTEDRISQFRECLKGDRFIVPFNTHVLIEDQPTVLRIFDKVPWGSQKTVKNLDSTAVSYMLGFNYIDKCSSLNFVSPRLKSSISFLDEDRQISSATGKKIQRTYEQNKKRSKDNFMYWCKTMNWNVSHIPNCSIDDVADAFLQTLAFVKQNKMIRVYAPSRLYKGL